MKIFLYGPSGSGKSTIGRALADQLSTPFIDLDSVIESRVGKTIADTFAQQGEPIFRKIETETLEEAASSSAGVIALGGGALLADANRKLAESQGDVVCLSAPLGVLVSRLEGESDLRPLLAGNTLNRLEKMLASRKAHYDSFHLQLNTEALEPAEAAWRVQVLAGRFRVSGMGAPYDVLVQPGSLQSLPGMLKDRDLTSPLALVSDATVGQIYGENLAQALSNEGFTVHRVMFPAGEDQKTIHTIEMLWEGFVQARLDRRSTVIALGGGVTGDLAGFASATYLRGVNWVCLPRQAQICPRGKTWSEHSMPRAWCWQTQIPFLPCRNVR
jgi:shikimate kinase